MASSNNKIQERPVIIIKDKLLENIQYKDKRILRNNTKILKFIYKINQYVKFKDNHQFFYLNFGFVQS